MTNTIDKHQFKITIATAIIVLIFIISLTAQLSSWRTQVQADNKEFDDRIIYIAERVVDIRADIKELNSKATERDIQLATINTKLASIEALLIEIKLDIKNK